MIKQKFWNKILRFVKEYAYFICTTTNFLLNPKANFRWLRLSQKGENTDTIRVTLPVPVCLTDSLLGTLSWVTVGTCTTGFGSPSRLQDSKVPVLSGMETQRAAKLLTQQEHETSPWQGLSSHRGAEPSFPSSSPALGDAKDHGGLSRLRSRPTSGIALLGMKCAPPSQLQPQSRRSLELLLAHSGVVQVSQRNKEALENTFAAEQMAKWGILFDFFVPHTTVLLPSKMRPEESCAAHPLSPPLPVVLSSSPVYLALSHSTVSARAQPIGRQRYGMRSLCRW